MKIIYVHIGSIENYPPVLSILQVLSNSGNTVHVITTDVTNDLKRIFKDTNIELISVEDNYEKPVSLMKKFIRLFQIKKKIWKNIDKYYTADTLIWVSHIETIKHMGKRLYEKRYVVHLFELYNKIAYTHKIPFLKINVNKLCNYAKRVIVSEYNRAHITMANWKLKELPAVLPNKPYNKREIVKNSKITSSKELEELLDKLKDKKIILYQGHLTSDRPLDEFIKAVDRLGDEYAFLVMSHDEDIYKKVNSKNYFYIPFISPPFHLEVTSHAYIGILSYVTTYKKHFGSQLNYIYCAPNKLYEYSMFGMPMIGNDIPGLSYPFEKYGFGKCVKQITANEIYNTIKKIEENYSVMARNSKEFYNKIDIEDIINNEILLKTLD